MSVGRNEPCPCGSGKKYKHCCVDKPGGGHLTGVGSCSGSDGAGRCGQPGSSATTCKLCGQLYASCQKHVSMVSKLMYGHIMRMHPETIPTDRFDSMLKDEAIMAEYRQRAIAAPAQWRPFFEYVEERLSGKPRTLKERAAAGRKWIADEAERQRALALGTRGKLVKWYDGAWEFLLSCGDDLPLWMFSAKLFPDGRGSIAADWQRLAAWSSAVGVPEGEREMGRTVESAPNAVHKWMWMEQPAAPPPPAEDH